MTHSDFRETEPMNHRLSDPPIKITREIPLPWLLSIVGAILVFSGTVYFTQQRQGELLGELKQEVQKLSTNLDSRTQKDQEHDYKLMDLDRRMTAQELSTRSNRK